MADSAFVADQMCAWQVLGPCRTAPEAPQLAERMQARAQSCEFQCTLITSFPGLRIYRPNQP